MCYPYAENVLITGNFLGSAGIVSFTRGTCMLKSSFVDERAAAEAVAADEDTMGMLTGCVKIPPSMTMEEAAPNVDEHMYWTCGLRVRGTFDCMRGGEAPKGC